MGGLYVGITVILRLPPMSAGQPPMGGMRLLKGQDEDCETHASDHAKHE